MSGAPVPALRAAAALLEAGRAAESRDALAPLLAAHPSDARAHGLFGLAEEALGRRAEALAALARAVALDPREPLAAQNYGALLLEAGRAADARPHLERMALALPESPTALGAAARCLLALGETEAAAAHGARRLALLDAQAPEAEAVAPRRPRGFDPDERARNLLSYSLFGANPYYRRCAIAVAHMAPAIHPEFVARFHLGPEIPETVAAALLDAGAQIRRMPAPSSPAEGLFWRFLAFDDPEARVVLARDVDSPLTARERVAVEDWLDGDRPFHAMRDNVGHAEPLLAGLWGGFTGLLPPLGPLIAAHLARRAGRHADQVFLRTAVWPRIRSACLTHDSVYRLRETRDFPPQGRLRPPIHVGWSWPRRPDEAPRPAL